MVICLSGRAVCESPHSFLPIWQYVQQLVLSIRPWFKRSHLLELDSACLTAFRTKQNCSLKVYEKQWSMSQTVQAQSLLPYVFQSPPDVLQLSANISWECATPGAGALVDSLSIRHSYNRRRQCTFYFLSYTNYTELKKKSLCVRVFMCTWIPMPMVAQQDIRFPGEGGTMGPFPLALSLFGSWPGSEWFGHMVSPWCATSKPTRPRDQGLKPLNWEPQHIFSPAGLTA